MDHCGLIPSSFSPLLGRSMETIFPVFPKVLSTTWCPCPICKYFCLPSSAWLAVSDLWISTILLQIEGCVAFLFFLLLFYILLWIFIVLLLKGNKNILEPVVISYQNIFLRKTKWANVTVSSSVDFVLKAFFHHRLCEMQSVLWSERETGNLPQRANIKRMWILFLISDMCFAYWNVSIWTCWWITTSDVDI